MTNTAMIQCSQRATRLYFSCEVIRISFFNETVISALLVRYVCPCGADQEIDLVLTTLQTFQNNMLSVEACRDTDDDADPVDLHTCRMRRDVEGAENDHAAIGGSRRAGDADAHAKSAVKGRGGAFRIDRGESGE